MKKNERSSWTLQKNTYKSVNKLLVFIHFFFFIKVSVRWQQRKSKYKIEETEDTQFKYQLSTNNEKNHL